MKTIFRLRAFLIVLISLVCLGSGFAQVVVTVPDLQADGGDTVYFAIHAGPLLEGDQTISFQYQVHYDPLVLRALGGNKTGSMLPGDWSLLANPGNGSGVMTVGAYGTSSLVGSGIVTQLEFEVIGSPGDATGVTVSQFVFNSGSPSASIEQGHFIVDYVLISLTTAPSGQTVFFDGISAVSPRLYKVAANSVHEISATAVENQDGATRRVWRSWSDGFARTHSVTAPAVGSMHLEATFASQYQVDLQVVPSGAGQVSRDPDQIWYDAETILELQAQSTPEFDFVNWTGDTTTIDSAITVRVDSALALVANFIGEAVQVEINTEPPGLQVMIDDQVRSAPQSLVWHSGETHRLEAISPQDSAGSSRYRWDSWDDGGAKAHEITISKLRPSYTARHTRQFQLTSAALPDNGGTVGVNPPGLWFDVGTQVEMSQEAAPGFEFIGWSGAISGTDSPQSINMDSTSYVRAHFEVRPEIHIDTPNGGETLNANSVVPIRWHWQGPLLAVRIEYSLDNGSTWQTIVSNTNNDGAYDWAVTPFESQSAILRITDADNAALFDVSDNPFVIQIGRIEIVINSDDEFDLFVNGNLIGSDGVWDQARTYVAPARNGNNVIGVKATNVGGAYGLIAEVRLNGEIQLLTDTSWRTNSTGPAGWSEPDFDDGGWQRAADLGRYGAAPWAKNIRDFPINSEAHWIWGSNGTSYLRTSFEFGVALPGPEIASFSPAGGLVGSEVLISGHHFVGLTGVSINDVPASYTVESENGIRASVPVGSTTGKIKVHGFGGSATSSSDFVVSVGPSISLISPNGGEGLAAGGTHEIRWTSLGGVGPLDLFYSLDNGLSWQLIVQATANDGSHDWNVPDTTAGSALVRLGESSDGEPADTSDASFAIAQSSLTLIEPNGGESWEAGSRNAVKWSSVGPIEDVKLEYSLDGGLSWVVFKASTNNDGRYKWTLPDVSGVTCLVRISDAADGAPSDRSDGVFAITQPPASMEVTINADDNYDLYVNGQLLGSNGQWDEAQTYTVPVRDGKNVVAIRGVNNSGPGALIAEVRIDGVVQLMTDASWRRTQSSESGWETIEFDDSGWLSAVDHGPYGSDPWKTQIAGMPQDTPARWIWSEDIRDLQFEWHFRGDFDYGSPPDPVPATELYLTYPNGSQNLIAGQPAEITWASQGEVSFVNLDYSIDNGQNWLAIAAGLANDGVEPWVVPTVETSEGLVRVVSGSDGSVFDQSDATFSILSPTVALTTVIEGGGGIVLTPPGGVYDRNTTVSVTAAADSGWTFSGWIGALSGNSATDSVLMDTNKSLTARFTEQDPAPAPQPDFHLDTAVVGSGTVALSPSGGVYASSTHVGLTATAAEGWVFAGWSGDLDGASNPSQLVMDSDKSVTARFEAAVIEVPQLGEMEIVINADDAYALWVNGVYVGGNDEWDRGQTYQVALVGGENVIAVHGINGGGPGAVIAEVRVEGEVVLVSDDSWKRHNTELSGWMNAGFDDSGWSAAVAHGEYGVIPWRENISGFPKGSRAQWLWSSDIRDADDLEWYFRGVFTHELPVDPPVITGLSPGSGEVGSEVVITGANFIGVSSVRFNGAHAPGFVVESPGQIRVAVPPGGSTGKVTVLAAGGSAGSESDFTVIIPPSVTLVSPNGGESLVQGSNQAITWSSTGSIANVALDFSLDNGGLWQELVANTANDGSFDWLVPGVVSDSALVRVRADSLSDASGAVFAIIPATVTLVSPNGGEGLAAGGTHEIRWTSLGGVGPLDLFYSLDNGLSWQLIVQGTANDGSYDWSVPDTTSGSAQVRLGESSAGEPSDTSDSSFAIAQSSLTLIEPNGGESWEAGSRNAVKWSSVGPIEDVKLEYSLDGGLSWVVFKASTDNDGRYNWTLPDVSGVTCLVRISDAADGAPSDRSDGVFAITQPPASMEVTINADDNYDLYVNGQLLGSNGQWDEAQTYTVPVRTGKNVVAIRGVNNSGPGALIAEVRIDGVVQLMTDASWRRTQSPGSGWETIEFDDSGWLSAVDHGPYGSDPWKTQIDGLPQNTPARWIWSEDIRDSQLEWHFRGDFDYGLSTPVPLISAFNPNSGTTGTEVTITGGNFTNVASVSFNGNNAASFTVDSQSVIRAVVPAGATSGPLTVATSGGNAQSSSDFTISQTDFISLYNPTGGENLVAGTTQAITWHANGPTTQVRVEYSSNAGADWTTLISSTQNDGRYDWPIPSPTDQAMIRISDSEDNGIFDISQVFSIFELDTTPLVTLIPNPRTLTIDDIGWQLGRDDSDTGGPFRLGTNRDPVLLDYEVLVYVAEQVGTRISAKFIISEFDRNNILANYPTTTEMGSNWDNTALRGPHDFEYMNYVIGNSAWLEMGLHGVRHEHWPTPGDLSRTEFYSEFEDHAWPYDRLQGHLEAFKLILAQYGVLSFPQSYVTPGNGYLYDPESGSDSGSLFQSFGVKYATSDIVKAGNFGATQQVIQDGGVIDNGVLWIRQANIESDPGWPAWNAVGFVPQVYPEDGVPITHWPNWWAENPQNNHSIGDQYVQWFDNVKAHPDWYVPKNNAQYYSQWLYRQHTTVVDAGGSLLIDNRNMPNDAYTYDLLGNLVFKFPLQSGEHISAATIDNGGQIVGYYEEAGYGYLILSQLSQDNFVLDYAVGPTLMTAYVANDGTYNVHSFVSLADSAYLLVEMYGTQEIKIRLPFEPRTVTSHEESLVINSFTYDSNSSLLTMSVTGADIMGQFGGISLSDSGSVTSLTLTEPNGGEEWTAGSTQAIRWNEGGFNSNVRLEYSSDNGVNWSIIKNSTSNDGRYNWDLPQTVSSTGLVRISTVDDPNVTDTSDQVFSIVAAPRLMTIIINCDDEFDLWVNGNYVGGDNQWDVAQIFEVPVVSGENVLAVLGTNLGNPGALIAEVRINGQLVLKTDESWRRLGSEEPGWTEIGHDDSGWLNAVSHGAYGASPWNLSINNLPDTSPAEWIWGEELREDYREWYFRGSFDESLAKPGNKTGDSQFVQSDIAAPKEFVLSQNYPNPFNSETLIQFSIPHAARVQLAIYNLRGELIRVLRNQEHAAGLYQAVWDGRNGAGDVVASGIYVYSVQAGSWRANKKLLFVR